MNALCLITFRPHKIWCDFLRHITYPVFIIVDDNTFNLTPFKRTYPTLTFINVANESCKTSGFMDTSFTLKKLICGWDKALYYFSEHTQYDHVWFMEDDVFFYDEQTLRRLDFMYTADLLSSTYEDNLHGDKTDWNWPNVHIKIPPPYYHGMMCTVRCSRQLLSCIKAYATQHHTLFFLEALFPTLAIQHQLSYVTPTEFDTVVYRHTYSKKDIHRLKIYHPVKNMNDHLLFRSSVNMTKLKFV